ncbi:hypothetical protein [Mucilaginibacter pedocola]|uniref:Uncharacterized protein n=1 Tax=Mucilaginibacter pedocola TaxID=1792845 RepID=A0A1S9PBH4_9SPHI|nr:hypothetical protein [Mucilaginibacter pedocola]OOQ58336.1 hypothetical protein BC343_11930 [Mucilaginibacter pedocola]
MRYTIDLNKITLANGYSIEFNYKIKKTLTVHDVVIIVIDPPYDVIYNYNVFAISLTGDFLWRIGEIGSYCWESDHCPYVEAIVNENHELVLFNWCDTAVIVNYQTGQVIRTYQTK